MEQVIRRVLRSETAWRYIDAYLPRGFALFLHTVLIQRYGGEAYALPAWTLGVLGVFLAALPDPHSFILVRRHGPGARRLLALTTPWLLLKAVIAMLLCTAVATMFAAPRLGEEDLGSTLVVLAALFAGSVEFIWATIGTASLAIGNVRHVALVGTIARFVAVLILLAGWTLGETTITTDFLIASAPVAVAIFWVLPGTRNAKRSVLFMWFSVKKYAFWSQGVGLVTILLFQLPSIVIGLTPIVSTAGIGQFAYFTRLFQVVLQPVQILQSIVIRDTARAAKGAVVNFRWPKRMFRVAGIGSALLTIVSASLGSKMALIDKDMAVLLGAVGCGLGVSTWYRFELAQFLATSGLRTLLVSGYLPVLAITLGLIVALVPLAGASGLGAAVFFGWTGMALSWKWTRVK